MTDLRKAAEMALEALEGVYGRGYSALALSKRCDAAIKALRQALAQPEQEFVGACVTCGAPKGEWLVDAVNISQERVDETAKHEHEPWPSVQCVCGHPEALEVVHFRTRPCFHYIHRPKREWVGLTDEEMRTLKQKSVDDGMTRIVSDFEYIRSIEAKLKEKNGG